MAKEYKWGYIDKAGTFVIDPVFDDAWEFHEGLAAARLEWASGYIDRTGQFVIPAQFQYAGPFIDGNALVQLDGLWGYIRPDGTWEVEPHQAEGNPAACPPSSSELPPEFVYSEGLAAAPKGKKYGYIDTAGKFVIKPQFIQASPFSEGLAAVLVSKNI